MAWELKKVEDQRQQLVDTFDVKLGSLLIGHDVNPQKLPQIFLES